MVFESEIVGGKDIVVSEFENLIIEIINNRGRNIW